jgi:hypothetical protein
VDAEKRYRFVCGVLKALEWKVAPSHAEELKAMLPELEKSFPREHHSVIEEFISESESEGKTWTPSS